MRAMDTGRPWLATLARSLAGLSGKKYLTVAEKDIETKITYDPLAAYQ